MTGDDKTESFGQINEHDQAARADGLGVRPARGPRRSETLIGRYTTGRRQTKVHYSGT